MFSEFFKRNGFKGINENQGGEKYTCNKGCGSGPPKCEGLKKTL
jgi:hypothetical protein